MTPLAPLPSPFPACTSTSAPLPASFLTVSLPTPAQPLSSPALLAQAASSASCHPSTALFNPLDPSTTASLLAPAVGSCAKPHPLSHSITRSFLAQGITHKFGTKSSYTPPHPRYHAELRSPFPCRGGTLVHVSLLARHGTRNPTRGSLKRMRTLAAFLRAQVARDHVPGWLHELTAVIDEWETCPGALTKEGVAELHQMGVRFRERYSAVLANTPMRIRSSHKPRAVASARAFLEGYGNERRIEVDILADGKDHSLRFYEARWNARYAAFAAAHKSVMRTAPLGECERATLIAERLTKELGCVDTLEPDQIRTIAEVCAFEHAHNRASHSHLCSKFTPHDALYLERFDNRYRPFFRGNELFATLTAPLVRDLIQSLEASIRREKSCDSPDTVRIGGSHLRASVWSTSDIDFTESGSTSDPGRSNAIEYHGADLRFAHAETLVPFLLLMGIPNLPGSLNLSYMSPFAGNIAIELWAPPVEGPHAKAGYRVRFRLHERYVDEIGNVPGGHRGWLELDTLLEFFYGVLEKDEMAR